MDLRRNTHPISLTDDENWKSAVLTADARLSALHLEQCVQKACTMALESVAKEMSFPP